MKGRLIILLITVAYVLKMGHMPFVDDSRVFQFHLIPATVDGEPIKYEIVWYLQFLFSRIIDCIIAYVLYRVIKGRSKSLGIITLVHLLVSIYHVISFVVFYELNTSIYVLVFYIVGVICALSKHDYEKRENI